MPGSQEPDGTKASGTGDFRPHVSWTLLFLALFCLGISLWWLWPRKAAPSTPSGGWPPEIEAKQETASENGLVYAGKPRPSQKGPTILVLRNKGYVVGYSESREDPLWVGYRLDGASGGPAGKRPSKFLTDSRTQSQVQHEEYTSTGFDRGHLAPNAGIAGRFGPDAQKETFFLTNIVPMQPDLNRRVWQKLERLESDEWAPRFGNVWVLTGPVFDATRTLLGDANTSDKSVSRIEIPDAFYKLIIDEEGSEVRVLPFLIPQNVRGTETPRQFLTSVDRIEQLTGLDFLWALNDPHEKAIEEMTPKNMW